MSSCFPACQALSPLHWCPVYCASKSQCTGIQKRPISRHNNYNF